MENYVDTSNNHVCFRRTTRVPHSLTLQLARVSTAQNDRISRMFRPHTFLAFELYLGPVHSLKHAMQGGRICLPTKSQRRQNVLYTCEFILSRGSAPGKRSGTREEQASGLCCFKTSTSLFLLQVLFKYRHILV